MIARWLAAWDARPVRAAALSGVVLAFCHPFVMPGSGGPAHAPILGSVIAWVALVPFLRAVEAIRSKKQMAAAVYACFGLQLALSVYWLDVPINRYGGLPHAVAFGAIVTIALITGAYLVITLCLARWTAARLGVSLRLLVPFFWLLGDHIRGAWIYGYPASGFPWAHLSATQVENPLTRQIAAIGGIELTALWVFAVNLAVLRLLEYRAAGRALFPAGRALVALIVPTLIWGVVWQRAAANSGEGSGTWRVGIVQGNLSQDIKNQINNRARYMLGIQRRLTAELSLKEPDILLWSEVTFPYALDRNNPQVSARALGLPEGGPVPALSLIGATVAWEEKGEVCGADAECGVGDRCHLGRCSGYRIHNSMLALDASMKLLGRTDKHNLVPFGEYVPGATLLNALGIGQLVPIAGRMRPAEKVAPIDTPVGKIGGLICYEGVFPAIPLTLARAGADLLVNPTNDTWYGRTSGPWQHLAFYRFRAVETGLPVVRSANSGISGWFDPSGGDHDLTALDEEAAVVVEVPRAKIRTPWVVLNGAPGWLILAIGPLLLVGATVRRS
jgi:apolipoprotein N-acyltransferase